MSRGANSTAVGAILLAVALDLYLGFGTILGDWITQLFKFAHAHPLLSLGASAAIIAGASKGVSEALEWRRSWSRCPHGVAGGKTRDQCENCLRERKVVEEKIRRERERAERQMQIEVEASKFRYAERLRLAASLIPSVDELRQITSQQFEDQVAHMFERMGYAVEQTPYVNDHGRDAILKKNGKKYLLECKRYGEGGLSGRPDLQKFHSAIITDGAMSGFFVTTGGFTKDAIEFAATVPIELIDSHKLIRYMFDSKPARRDDDSYLSMCRLCGDVVHHRLRTPRSETCRNRHDVAPTLTLEEVLTASGAVPTCECGAPMRLVHWKKRRFWGCTRYPKCRLTQKWRPHERHQLVEDTQGNSVIRCPNPICEQKLKVPARKLLNIKCPSCKHSFQTRT